MFVFRFWGFMLVRIVGISVFICFGIVRDVSDSSIFGVVERCELF